MALETKITLELLGDLAYQPSKPSLFKSKQARLCQKMAKPHMFIKITHDLSDEEIRALLVLPNLSKGDSARTVPLSKRHLFRKINK